MLKRSTFLVLVVLVSACGQFRPQLNWPANVASIENLEDASADQVRSNIEDLNSKLSAPILSLTGGTGSNIHIKRVDALEDRSFSELSYVGLVGRFNLMSTRIAGRATLSWSECTIELASFLLESPAKDLLLPVLWHEIGHCTGIDHVEEAGEVMSPVTYPITKYTDEHLARFFALIENAVKGKY